MHIAFGLFSNENHTHVFYEHFKIFDINKRFLRTSVVTAYEYLISLCGDLQIQTINNFA